MYCPVSRIKLIAITGYSNLLRNNNIVKQTGDTIFRNVSIILPDDYTAAVNNKTTAPRSGNGTLVRHY